MSCVLFLTRFVNSNTTFFIQESLKKPPPDDDDDYDDGDNEDEVDRSLVETAPGASTDMVLWHGSTIWLFISRVCVYL